MKTYDIDKMKNLEDIKAIARYFLENWDTLKPEGKLEELLIKYLNRVNSVMEEK